MASVNVMSTAAVPTPSYPYSCPPPPYSQPSSASTNSAPGLPGIKSSPTSRWSPKDETEQKPVPRQSLPSIHEALGSDQPLQYSAPPPPAPTSAPQSYQSQPLPSPSEHARRSHTTEPSQQQPAQYPPHTPRSPAMDRPRSVTGHRHNGPMEAQRSSYPSQSTSKLPTLHPLQTSRSPQMPAAPPPQSGSYTSYPQHSSPAYVSGPPPTPPSAHQAHFPYGYARPSQYAYSTSTPTSAYPPHQASTYSASDRYQQPWKNDGSDILNRAEESKRAGSIRGPAFGESVKRHLEFFDFEASLNEIADTSAILQDFARMYQQRAHQTQRNGPTPGSLPEIPVIEDMQRRSTKFSEALARIKDVVITQQTAMAQQAQARQYNDANDYEHSEQNGIADDIKSQGFAGGDSKKRRGRAAPPGRCHSCNRAETPEWRRGPDGARTLCNACGLHYAKLTRKMGTNKANVGSSNLRPKELGPGSPAT